jgi:hypothetical protein
MHESCADPAHAVYGLLIDRGLDMRDAVRCAAGGYTASLDDSLKYHCIVHVRSLAGAWPTLQLTARIICHKFCLLDPS